MAKAKGYLEQAVALNAADANSKRFWMLSMLLLNKV